MPRRGGPWEALGFPSRAAYRAAQHAAGSHHFPIESEQRKAREGVGYGHKLPAGWKYDGVPGKGWVKLRAAILRVRTGRLVLLGDIRVSTQTEKIHSAENAKKLERAIRRKQKGVRIERGATLYREEALVLQARDWGPGHDGWLAFWSSVLGIEVLGVYRWNVFRKVK